MYEEWVILTEKDSKVTKAIIIIKKLKFCHYKINDLMENKDTL